MLKTPPDFQLSTPNSARGPIPGNDPRLFSRRARTVLSTLPKITKDKLKNEIAYIRSNDPTITGLEKFRVKAGEQLMLVASTSLNPIAVACELAMNNGMQLIPQVVIIDNGGNASKVWRELTHFFKENDAKEFNDKLPNFIETHYSSLTSYSQPDDLKAFKKYVMKYVEEVIQKYRYDFVKAVILQTVYLEQKWEDESTFAAIKNFIDVSECKNIFVYPSDIVSINNEYYARRICQNIYTLNPVLTIHTNINMDLLYPTEFLFFEGIQNAPDVVIERLTSAISFNDTQKSYLEGIQIFWFTPKEYVVHCWLKMQNAIAQMISDNQYGFNQFTNPFILDVILKLAGIETKIDYALQEQAAYHPKSIFHLKNSVDEMAVVAQALTEKFPCLKAGFALLGQTTAKPELPTRFKLDVEGIIQILPLIPPFLRDNPDIRQHYENSELVFSHKLTDFFKNFDMSPAKSDCFEETLCLLVKEKFKAKGIQIEELKTTNSYCFADPSRSYHNNILITAPIQAAQFIANYFNEIAENSAFVEEKQEWIPQLKLNMTKIVVANATLVTKQFFDDLKYAVEHLISNEELDKHRLLAGYCMVTNSLQRLGM
jgi:hypothetical protein